MFIDHYLLCTHKLSQPIFSLLGRLAPRILALDLFGDALLTGPLARFLAHAVLKLASSSGVNFTRFELEVVGNGVRLSWMATRCNER